MSPLPSIHLTWIFSHPPVSTFNLPPGIALFEKHNQNFQVSSGRLPTRSPKSVLWLRRSCGICGPQNGPSKNSGGHRELGLWSLWWLQCGEGLPTVDCCKPGWLGSFGIFSLGWSDTSSAPGIFFFGKKRNNLPFFFWKMKVDVFFGKNEGILRIFREKVSVTWIFISWILYVYE